MEQELSSIGRMTQNLIDSGTDLGLRILVAVLTYIVGRILINWILKALSKIKSVVRMDETARIYVRNIIKAVLYTALFVTMIAELGVPISSVVAIIVAAGAAVGLALRRVQRCYGTAVPFYYVAGGYVSTLIPLDLTGDGKPDVALAVQRAESGAYLARTVLTLQMAYNGARLISGLEGCWLSAAVETAVRDETCEVEAYREPMLLSA